MPGSADYREEYFDHYPGVGAGDFFKVNGRGGSSGRPSDEDVNRQRVYDSAPAEVYRPLLEGPKLEDSMIVNID